MSLQNIAFYFQNYQVYFRNSTGTIQYSTVGLIPSQTIAQRVANLEMQGSLHPTNEPHEIVFDFSNVKSPYNLHLEGPLEGQFNYKCKTKNANKYIKYDQSELFTNRILKLFIDYEKQSSFYFNITIKDTSINVTYGQNGSTTLDNYTIDTDSGRAFYTFSPTTCPICPTGRQCIYWSVYYTYQQTNYSSSFCVIPNDPPIQCQSPALANDVYLTVTFTYTNNVCSNVDFSLTSSSCV